MKEMFVLLFVLIILSEKGVFLMFHLLLCFVVVVVGTASFLCASLSLPSLSKEIAKESKKLVMWKKRKKMCAREKKKNKVGRTTPKFVELFCSFSFFFFFWMWGGNVSIYISGKRVCQFCYKIVWCLEQNIH